mmetsp:Transcript_12956/g.32883  ORF Transcript_12956/g.32883 Transcript_12956/m.32883 type:complete len:198 (-) Transcript_12956:440-1033(-)
MSRLQRRPLTPVSVQGPSEWAISTAGGLVVQGPSRRSMLRMQAPNTPPLLRPGELSAGKQQQRARRPPPSPLGEPLSPSTEGLSIPRVSRRVNRDSTQMAAEDSINSFSNAGAVDKSPSHRGGGDGLAWAVSTSGGLQITGPSQRWMMRESAPSTPQAMRPLSANPGLRPFSANPALQRGRREDQHAPSGHHETVRM